MSRLSWAPVDSTEARELRELELERAAEDRTQVRHDGRCQGGWLGEDSDGRPVPCMVCRPHLAAVPCRTCQTSPHQCADQLANLRGRCCDACDHGSTPAAKGA